MQVSLSARQTSVEDVFVHRPTCEKNHKSAEHDYSVAEKRLRDDRRQRRHDGPVK
jgi:hypothetical protein